MNMCDFLLRIRITIGTAQRELSSLLLKLLPITRRFSQLIDN